MKKQANASSAAAEAATDAPDLPDAAALLAAVGAPDPDAPITAPVAPSLAGDRPSAGGSYIVQADDTLVRRAATIEPGLIERVAAEAEGMTNG